MASKDESPPSGERDIIDFVSQITDAARFRIEENLPHGFVRLKVAEADRRQAQHDIRSVEDIVTELVRNTRDAGARHVLVARAGLRRPWSYVPTPSRCLRPIGYHAGPGAGPPPQP